MDKSVNILAILVRILKTKVNINGHKLQLTIRTQIIKIGPVVPYLAALD